MVKSKFHLEELTKLLGPISNYKIIPNGVRLEEFENDYNVKRNPYRFCFSSNYDWGLEFIITGIFPIIKKLEPRAEFHIYGGMDDRPDYFREKITKLLSNVGICDHGKQSYEIIAREKHLSTFHLYIANIINEIDAVDIKESIVAGCIPITAKFGVFLETESIRFNMNHQNPVIMENIARNILKLMNDKENVNKIRDIFKKSSTIDTWLSVCKNIYNNII